MNRPKQHNKSKRPQLWTRPLTRSAELNARLHLERDIAQVRPFAIAWMLFVPVGMLLLFGTMLVPRVPSAIPGPMTRPLISKALAQFGESMLWLGATLLVFEVITARAITMRTKTKPAPLHLKAGHPASFLILAGFVLLYISLAAMLQSFIPFAMLAWLLAIYLITTGIRRRTGWDRRCAKCAYPHPDPKPYPITCPECGRTLEPDSHTHIILGHNTHSLPRIAIGLALLAALLAAATVL